MNTKLLRQKILDLAIRGKLTDQRKSDGTARELLEQISAKESSSTSTLSSPRRRGSPSSSAAKTIIPLDKSEAPFEIPDNWEWVRLGNVAYIASGSTPSKECFVDDGVPYLKMYNLKNQAIDFDYKPQYIKRETHEGKLARSKARPGDVIMNIVGPPLGKIAIIPDSLPECNFNQAAVLIRAHYQTRLMNQYIRYFLLQMGEINSINTKGTAGQENISLTQSQNMRLPLPPLAEQQRIVAKIEEAFAEIDAVEKNKELLKTHIKQTRQKILDLAIHGKLVPQDKNDEPASVLLEKILQEKVQSDTKKSSKKKKTDSIATSDNRPYEKIEDVPFEIPENWMWVRLPDVCRSPITDGTHNSPPNSEDGSFFYITAKNIKDSGIDLTNVSYVSKDIHDFIISRCQPEKGDVLLTKDGTIGNATVNNLDSTFSLLSSVALIKTHPKVLPWFVVFCLRSSYLQKIMKDDAKGTALKRIILTQINEFTIPLPPLNEQSRIVSKIQELFSTLDQMERNHI